MFGQSNYFKAGYIVIRSNKSKCVRGLVRVSRERITAETDINAPFRALTCRVNLLGNTKLPEKIEALWHEFIREKKRRINVSQM